MEAERREQQAENEAILSGNLVGYFTDESEIRVTPLKRRNARLLLMLVASLAADAYEKRLSEKEGEYAGAVKFRDAVLDSIANDVDALFIQSEQFNAALKECPTDAVEALAALYLTKAIANDRARQALATLKEWADKDVLSGRIREECVAELVKGSDEVPGISPTAAKTAASAHPRYTAFRDEVTALAAIKDAAAVESEIALRNFQAARDAARLIPLLPLTKAELDEIHVAAGAAALADRPSTAHEANPLNR